MADIISLPLWHVVVFILGGVALGAVIPILSLALSDGRKAEGQATRPRAPVSTKAAPAPVRSAPQSAVARGLSPNNKEFLDRCVLQRRALTVDKAAEMLGVSARRVRRLMDSGDLRARIMPDGTRRVTSVSVHDFIVRQLTGHPPRPVRGASRAPSSRMQQEPLDTEDEGADSGDDGEGEEVRVVPKKAAAKPPTKAATAKTAALRTAASEFGSDPEEEDSPTYAQSSSASGEVMGVAGPHQRYWYFIEGYSTPYRSIRAALGAMGLSGAGFSWRELPAEVRAKMRRERVQEPE